ncbi:MAG: hypothetical protein ACE5GX_12965 [Thermoanaerobaculia bacterium]
MPVPQFEMNPHQLEAIGIVLTLALGAAGIVWSLQGVKKGLWLTSFLTFTGRYSEIISSLPPSMRVGNASGLDNFKDDERQRVVDSIRLYCNLASEEFWLHSKKYLDSATWGVWKQGIIDFMKTPAAWQAWTEIRTEYEYFPEFANWIDTLGPRPTRKGGS